MRLISRTCARLAASNPAKGNFQKTNRKRLLVRHRSRVLINIFLLLEIQIDEALVQQLAEMGFAVEGCRKAVYHTKNAGSEAAMAWILEHMEDAGNLGAKRKTARKNIASRF